MSNAQNNEENSINKKSDEKRDTSESRLMNDIISLSSNLLVIDKVEDFINRIAELAVTHFPIKSMIIYVRDESGNFQVEYVYGYPEDRIPVLKEKAVYSLEEVEEMEKTLARSVGRFSKFYPAELVNLDDERDILTTLDVDKLSIPRKEKDDFHPLDALVVRMLDRSEREIGSLFITGSTTEKHFDSDSLNGLEMLASFASVSIELMRLRRKEQNLLDSLENRATQISQIFAVTSSIATLSDPKKLATRILELIQELFGFKSGAIALLDEMEGCYKWKSLRGYTQEDVYRALSMNVPKEITEHDIRPEYKIGYLAHYKPAEKTLLEDLPYFFTFASMEEAEKMMKVPRESPDSWHPLDDLTFVIYDRTGRIIGIISPDNPSNNQIPSRDTIELIEVFVSMVAIAYENAAIYQDASKARDEVRILNRLMFHDLMNYSMAIRGYLDLSLNQPSDALSDKYIERAMRQIEQTSDLIAKVRKLSAIKSADKKNLMRIDLATTIRNQAVKTSSIFPVKKVKYNFSMESEEAYVMANDLLPDLFHNIFMNAIKFDMHETVVIDVQLKKIDDPTDPRNALWQVSIADNGSGIPDDRKHEIFLGTDKISPSEPTSGMGLGLSIVKSLVGLYNGKVWAEDKKPGDYTKGTIFNVRLPVA